MLDIKLEPDSNLLGKLCELGATLPQLAGTARLLLTGRMKLYPRPPK